MLLDDSLSEEKRSVIEKIRKIALDNGPKNLRSYYVQNKMGPEGGSLYSSGVYHYGNWRNAVNAALEELNLTYDLDVKVSKPWGHVKSVRVS